MSTGLIVTIIVIVVVVIVVLAAIAAFRRRQQQQSREQTREEFGSEYERATEEHGSEREAERELRDRQERVESRVRPLSDGSRKRYGEQWDEVERTFVDNPVAALEMADRTVSDIMRERNFPTDGQDDSEGAAQGIGVVEPGVAEDYREAQGIRRGVGREDEGREDQTEEMRQAIRKYRSVYERLVRNE